MRSHFVLLCIILQFKSVQIVAFYNIYLIDMELARVHTLAKRNWNEYTVLIC